MVTKKQTKETKYGERPFLYTRNPTRRMNKEIYANEYVLMAGDSFEVGGAHSLHTTKKISEEYEPSGRCWASIHRNIQVFVSKPTLEKLMENGGTVFSCWEN
ncbi:hypothetical protein HOA55_05445 [archaeon]|jgi:hypothetical protein|nr:hypothetical protein [archaeon]MBT3577765.1 hypothetical protein [archaeon]MBT6820772.1 hypothetical protein [archaeon]MBT6956319.1 hypothetical protein [archaeon]MBT7025912.1 hypothetical protein [archaeon]